MPKNINRDVPFRKIIINIPSPEAKSVIRYIIITALLLSLTTPAMALMSGEERLRRYKEAIQNITIDANAKIQVYSELIRQLEAELQAEKAREEEKEKDVK